MRLFNTHAIFSSILFLLQIIRGNGHENSPQSGGLNLDARLQSVFFILQVTSDVDKFF